MAGPAVRIVAQALAAMSSVVVRAFGQALAQAEAKAAQNATRAAANGGKKAAEEEFKEEEKVAEEDEVKKATSSMRIDEAWKVMGLESTATAEDIRDRYKHLFHVTDKENGGSFYIQSKVVMAKEAVDLEIDPLPLDDDADEDEGKDTEMEGRDEKVGDDNDGDDGSDKGKKEKKETKKD